MKKFISHFWHSGGVKKFDTDTGSVKRAPKQKYESTGFGSIWKQNGKYFAFYDDEKSMLLQYNNKKWRVAPEFQATLYGYLFIRNFRIKKNEKVVFSIWYKPKGILFSFIDPTYDLLDAESDDFFLYVKNMWSTWGNQPYSMFLKEFEDKN